MGNPFEQIPNFKNQNFYMYFLQYSTISQKVSFRYISIEIVTQIVTGLGYNQK